jgi:hypothetical protein
MPLSTRVGPIEPTQSDWDWCVGRPPPSRPVESSRREQILSPYGLQRKDLAALLVDEHGQPVLVHRDSMRRVAGLDRVDLVLLKRDQR